MASPSKGTSNSEKGPATKKRPYCVAVRGATYVWHGRGDGRPSKDWRGWTGIALVDLKSTLPVAWVQRPANRPEGEALVDLVERLFALWPDCPCEFIVGDSAYDDRNTAWELELCFGIHPVF